jgi:hypothetical protein
MTRYHLRKNGLDSFFIGKFGKDLKQKTVSQLQKEGV